MQLTTLLVPATSTNILCWSPKSPAISCGPSQIFCHPIVQLFQVFCPEGYPSGYPWLSLVITLFCQPGLSPKPLNDENPFFKGYHWLSLVITQRFLNDENQLFNGYPWLSLVITFGCLNEISGYHLKNSERLSLVITWLSPGYHSSLPFQT